MLNVEFSIAASEQELLYSAPPWIAWFPEKIVFRKTGTDCSVHTPPPLPAVLPLKVQSTNVFELHDE